MGCAVIFLSPIQAERLWEWDDRFTSKMFGFKDWKEYYSDGHSFRKLPYVEIPMLIINAEDDPLSPNDCKYPFCCLDIFRHYILS